MAHSTQQGPEEPPEDPRDTITRWLEQNHERLEKVAKAVGLAPATWLQQTLDLCIDADERLVNRPPRVPQTHAPIRRPGDIVDPQGRI